MASHVWWSYEPTTFIPPFYSATHNLSCDQVVKVVVQHKICQKL